MSDSPAVLLRAIDPVELGRRIRTLRIERQMNQAALGAGAASIGYVSRIESGQRRPELSVLEGLAANLGVTAAELLLGDATPERARVKLELDYAELELNTGSAAAARVRLRALDGVADRDLAEAAALLDALATEALGEDPLPALRALTAHPLVGMETWFRAQIALARCLREAGDPEAAIAAGESAVATAHDRGWDGVTFAVQLAVTVAAAYDVRGDSEKALLLCQRAVEAAERLGDGQAAASAYWNASSAEASAGNIGAALDLAERALTYFDARSEAHHRANLLTNIGIYLSRSEPPQLEEALARLTEAGALLSSSATSLSDVGRNDLAIARVHRLAGRLEDALAAIDALLDRGSGIGPYVSSAARLVRGQLLHGLGLDGADDEFAAAVLAASAVGTDRRLATFWYEIAATLEASGDAAGAIDAYKRAAIASGAVPYSAMARVGATA